MRRVVLVTSSSSLSLSSLELSDTKVYEPYIRALLGTASHFCEVFVLKSRTVPNIQAGGVRRVVLLTSLADGLGGSQETDHNTITP